MSYIRLFGHPTVRVRCKLYSSRGSASLFYTGTAEALAWCGAATEQMMAAAPGGAGHLDADGDFFSLKIYPSPNAAGNAQRFRLFRRKSIAKALRLPGVRQSIQATAAEEALFDAVKAFAPRRIVH